MADSCGCRGRDFSVLRAGNRKEAADAGLAADLEATVFVLGLGGKRSH
jgi:hypothetical protein